MLTREQFLSHPPGTLYRVTLPGWEGYLVQKQADADYRECFYLSMPIVRRPASHEGDALRQRTKSLILLDREIEIMWPAYMWEGI
jgi:hypothetical protein